MEQKAGTRGEALLGYRVWCTFHGLVAWWEDAARAEASRTAHCKHCEWCVVITRGSLKGVNLIAVGKW